MWYEDSFLAALGITLVVSVAALVYLHDALARVLEDYCGDAVRAKFWVALAHLFVVLVPLVSEMLFTGRPDYPQQIHPHDIVAALKWGLLGLVGGLVTVGVAVGTVGRSGILPVWVDAEQADALNRMLSRVHERRARELVERLDREAAEAASFADEGKSPSPDGQLPGV